MFPSTYKKTEHTVTDSEERESAKITFCGGVSSVTGANFLLDINKISAETGKLSSFKLLVDCGMEQGSEHARTYNSSPFIFDPKDIHMLLVTHAHMDHIGLIPKLVKHGFRGVIYSTPETRDLSVFMLDDALKLVTQEASHASVTPLYGPEDLHVTFDLWKTIKYHEDVALFDFGNEDKDGKISVYLKKRK